MPHPTPNRLRAALILAALTLGPLPALAESVTVFAAASLKSALTAIGDAWALQTGHSVTYSFAGTPALAQQIAQGAPADLFISASVEWMDHLAETGDIRPHSRRDLLGNRLVLVAHGAGVAPVKMDNPIDLAARLAGGTLAMALVDAVPAGQYGKQALMTLGLWDSVSALVVQAENVTGALNFVINGAADLGIVYATDAHGVAGVTVIGTFPASSHRPITYPAARTTHSTSALAEAFLNYLTSPNATTIWRDAGFNVLP